MRGFLCDVCATFITGSPPATFTAMVFLGEEPPRRKDVEAHFCDDCTIDLAQGWGLLEGEIRDEQGQE